MYRNGSFGIAVLLVGTALSQTAQAQLTGGDATETAPTANDIVVTAQKRSERLEDVPVSVSVVSRDQLTSAGSNSIADLSQTVSGLHVDFTGPFTQPTIRGVGSALSGTGVAGNVANYVDGFYRPSQTSADIEFSDVSSIQVLKGPQGSLFGRNATGGAILITTRDPSFTDMQVEARAGYASFDDKKGALFVSAPLGGNLATSLSVFGRRKDGFVRNIVTGNRDGRVRQFALRNKWLYEPSDNVRLALTYEHTDISDPRGMVANAYEGRTVALNIPGAVVPTRRGQVANNFGSDTKINSDGVYFRADIDLGGFELVSYTGFRNEKDRLILDLDGTNIPILAADFLYDQDVFTHEVNLQSKPGSRLQWLVGAFYYDEKTKQPDFSIAIGAAPQFTLSTSFNNTRSYAIFGDFTYQVSDRLFLTLGGRYSHERAKSGFAAFPVFAPDGASKSWSSFKPRAVVRYEIDPNSSVYASFTQAYKAGLFNTSGQSKVPIDPENITAYEIGFKTARQGLRFETAGFYYDYKNLQVSSYRGPVAVIQNAARARIYGADAHLFVPVSDAFTIDLGGTYLNTKYKSFEGAPQYKWDPVATTITIAPNDASGNRGLRAPRLSGNTTLTYRAELGGGKLELSANASYNSRTYFNAFESLSQKGYALLNLRASWTDPSDVFTLAVYGRNVTDTNYRVSLQEQPTFIGQIYGEPVSAGVELAVKF